MKILIFSDSHLSLSKIVKMVELEKPQVVICGGDHSKDAQELSYIEESPKYYIVRGNCDAYDHNFTDILQFSLEGQKFYLTHGHLHGVKMTLEKLKKDAENFKENIVIFGHTHIPHYEVDRGIHYFNPGSAREGRYGLLYLDEKTINFEHKILD